MLKKGIMALSVLAALSACGSDNDSNVNKEKVFKYSFQGDFKGLDPYALYETFQMLTMENIYDTLVARDKDLKIIPSLAKSWKVISDTKWEFKLQQGVKFHNGNDFTAEDVVFSWQRALGSDLKVVASKIKNINIVDDYTVIIETYSPLPLLPSNLRILHMMDKDWAVKNNVETVSINNKESYTYKNTNGTGPFELVSYQPGVKAVFKRFAGYWNAKNVTGNVDKVEFTPIAKDSTRVAALLSGAVDMAYPIPIQDFDRLQSADGITPSIKPETRAVFLGFDQWRDELSGSSVKGENPFKDKRVRAAFVHAVDTKIIKEKIMGGKSYPTGIIIADATNGWDAQTAEPYAYDLEKSKKLMADAGYADGFRLIMDCPNNRYVNDEKICQAVVSMLSKINVTVDLNAQPKSLFFSKIIASGGYDTSFYMLGWSPSTQDAQAVLSDLATCREDKSGAFNIGNYCNPKIKILSDKIAVEMDTVKRNALIKEAFTIIKADYGYLPLHAQSVFWGISKNVEVEQRSNNVVNWRNIIVK